MGFYAKRVLSRFMDLRNRETARLRAEFSPSRWRRCAGAHGTGEGGGRTAGNGILPQSTEETAPLPNSSADTIVITWTLRSRPNAPQALGEMQRILKAEDRLIFLEHGLAPDSGVAARQDFAPITSHED